MVEFRWKFYQLVLYTRLYVYAKQYLVWHTPVLKKGKRVWIPAGAAGEFSSLGSTFCADSFWYPFHPCVTAVARKRSWPFCQKNGGGRLQLNMHALYVLWLCMKWHGTWVYGVHRTRWDGSSFMWHQPCQRCKYTTSVDIQKRTIKN